MEDILAIVAVLAMVGVFWFALNKLIVWRTEKKEAEEKRLDEIRKQAEDARTRMRNRRMEQAVKNIPTAPKPAVRVSEPIKPSYAPSSTQSVSSYDSSSNLLSDIADIAMIANTIHHWNDNSRSETPREERSVGVTRTESSWGFDDSDSRKSISSSMDTSSWSDSSSSSDSWSSSDSGPSSDW
jgi:hypothetical protein